MEELRSGAGVAGVRRAAVRTMLRAAREDMRVRVAELWDAWHWRSCTTKLGSYAEVSREGDLDCRSDIGGRGPGCATTPTTSPLHVHGDGLVSLAVCEDNRWLAIPSDLTIPSLKDLRKRFTRNHHVNGQPSQAVLQSEGSPPSASTTDNGESHQAFEHDGRTYTEAQLRHLTDEIKDYQIVHGSLLKVVEYESESSVQAQPIGVSILPTPLPRRCFDEAIELQPAYSELYMRIASDPEWLYEVLKPLKDHDRFFTVLWEIYERVRETGVVQNVVCAVFRNDYMLHRPPDSPEGHLPSIKQVEMNTFSCAGAAHAERVANMHKHLERVKDHSTSCTEACNTRLPENNNTSSIVTMLAQAHSIYTSTSPPSPRKKCILMTVQPFNFNIADERPIEQALWSRNIPCYRSEWCTLFPHTTLLPDRTLLFQPPLGGPPLEVSVIYYRGGYVIEEYAPSGKALRIKLELSRAIKCPDILTHLAGFKTVQAALTSPGAVERFLRCDDQPAARLRATFMPMQILDTTPAGLHARALATNPATCVNYILKPNRDGGGHNIHRSAIPAFLASRPEAQWHQYVLMRVIEAPPGTTATLMMPQELYRGAAVSEVGVLGTCIWERKGAEKEVEVRMNEVAGWTFKTKMAGVDEMSVVKGFGCFDCPLLI